MKWSSWVLVWLLSLPALAQIPEPVVPAGVGVNIHFVTGHERDLDLIRAAGFKFIRMDFGWSSIETEKGKYDWTGYEKLLGNLDKRGLREVFILDYSNPLYEQQVTSTNPLTHQLHHTIASPQHPASVAAFAAWAAASAAHFKGRHVVWELWNEPNIDFWSPTPDVKQYVTLALAASQAIRQADPAATIVGPASSGFPWEYLEAFLKSGILEFLDAVSVHPYREPRRPPETVAADYQKLRAMVDRYSPPDKPHKIPILSGEWGYSSWKRGVSLENQAAFAVRQQLVNLLYQVPLSIWYDWKNDGEDPNENEHNFGTVLPDLSAKPAYLAIQTMTRQLAGFRVELRLKVENDQDYLLVCSDSVGKQKLVAWTMREPHSITFALKGAAPQLVGISGTGQTMAAKVEAGNCSLELTTLPQYLDLGAAQLP